MVLCNTVEDVHVAACCIVDRVAHAPLPRKLQTWNQASSISHSIVYLTRCFHKLLHTLPPLYAFINMYIYIYIFIFSPGLDAYEKSTTSSLSMTHAQIRIKERYRKKSPNDQKKLAPSIPTEFLGRTRELNLAQSFLLTKPSQYHHSKLEHTEALIEPKVALSDLKYCPTDVQEGEGKSYSYLRSLQKSKPTMAADLRSDAKEFWGKGVPLGSKHPRGALIKNTFWSKALGSTF